MRQKDIEIMYAPANKRRQWYELRRVQHGQEFEEMTRWLANSGLKLNELDKAMLSKAGEIHHQELKKELEARLRKLFAGADMNYELERAKCRSNKIR